MKHKSKHTHHQDGQNKNKVQADKSFEEMQATIENLEQAEYAENGLIEKTEKELADLRAKNEELANAYARAVADLQNLRRRTEKEKRDLTIFANANLILEILPILDNFERALEHAPVDKTPEWEGVLQIYEQFQKVLISQGVEEIASVGEKLDPQKHEALLHVAGEDGMVVQELEKGYLLKGKVIRPAKVGVGNGQEVEAKD